MVIGQRGVEPFKGQWCLPCGYVNQYEDPREAIEREVPEETGLVVRSKELLLACMPPLPGRPVNQVILHYHCEVIGGEMKAGDDLLAVKTISPCEMPVLCFETHQMVVARWFTQMHGIRIAA